MIYFIKFYKYWSNLRILLEPRAILPKFDLIKTNLNSNVKIKWTYVLIKTILNVCYRLVEKSKQYNLKKLMISKITYANYKNSNCNKNILLIDFL